MVTITTPTGIIIKVDNLKIITDSPQFADKLGWVMPEEGFSPSVPHPDLKLAELIIDKAFGGDAEITQQDPPPPTVPGRVY